MLNSVSDRITVKRIARLQPMRQENGFGMGNGKWEMGNGFHRRIRDRDGFARPVLAISRAGVEGDRSWIQQGSLVVRGFRHQSNFFWNITLRLRAGCL
jgi:hypothetical protein